MGGVVVWGVWSCEGAETVCRVCQTNGAGPCGTGITMGSVSVKRANTISARREGEHLCVWVCVCLNVCVFMCICVCECMIACVCA